MNEPSRRLPGRTALAGAALWVVLGGLLLTAGFVAFALRSMESSNQHLNDSNQQLAQGQQAQATVIAKLASGLDTTRHQLKQHGVTPKAPAASSIVKGVQGVPGVPGPAGATGAAGTAGSPGPSGAPGRSGSNGSPGAAGSPGPAGPSGSPGVGNTGAAGQTGSTGPAGPQGPKGDTGEQGPKGDTGATGAAGPPPSGWSFTYPPGALGVTYNCTPDGAGSTHYSCAPAGSAPLKSNSPAKGAVAVGGLLAMAAYRRLDPTGRRTD
ncbi:hypothetical protein ACFXGR_22825 [Streptomyces mirabilis]|uniref:hypothetical protein n=1 Tax=Streptomyces mirabilis TaxID=68239 RepID=UPI0036CE33F4